MLETKFKEIKHLTQIQAEGKEGRNRNLIIKPTELVSPGIPNKIPQLWVLKQQRFIFSWFWRLEISDQGLAYLVSGEVPILACRELPSSCVLTWPSLGVGVGVWSYKATKHVGQGPHPMTSFDLNYL